MPDKKFPNRFSEETRQLQGKKSGLLFYARWQAEINDPIESARAFAKAAHMEEDIATRLEAEGYPQQAMVSWVSAASCYLMAHDFAQALRVCELIEDKPFAERYQDVFRDIKTDCESQIAKPLVMTDNKGHSNSAQVFRAERNDIRSIP